MQSAFEVASFLRHKTLIALITACFLFLGVVYARSRPVFSKQLQTGPNTLISPAPVDSSLVQNQIEIIQSQSILLKAVQALSLKDDIELSSEVPSLSERVQTWLTQSIDLPSVIVEVLAALHSRRAASIWATAEELKTERALDGWRQKLSVKRVGSAGPLRVETLAMCKGQVRWLESVRTQTPCGRG